MSHSGLSLLRDAHAVENGPTSAGAWTRRSILVVDIDLAIRDSLKSALQEEGFDVLTAANGCEALEVLRAGERPSAILLDLMMPVMDGWDFRQERLADPALRDIPVLIVTAAGFSSESVRTQFGDLALFSKPVPWADLVDFLERVCSPISRPPSSTSIASLKA